MYDRDYYEANRERINQQHRENYVKHRDTRTSTPSNGTTYQASSSVSFHT